MKGRDEATQALRDKANEKVVMLKAIGVAIFALLFLPFILIAAVAQGVWIAMQVGWKGVEEGFDWLITDPE